LSVDARLRRVRQSLLDGSKDNALFGLWLVVDGNSESLEDFLAQAVFNRNSLSFLSELSEGPSSELSQLVGPRSVDSSSYSSAERRRSLTPISDSERPERRVLRRMKTWQDKLEKKKEMMTSLELGELEEEESSNVRSSGSAIVRGRSEDHGVVKLVVAGSTSIRRHSADTTISSSQEIKISRREDRRFSVGGESGGGVVVRAVEVERKEETVTVVGEDVNRKEETKEERVGEDVKSIEEREKVEKGREGEQEQIRKEPEEETTTKGEEREEEKEKGRETGKGENEQGKVEGKE